MAIKSAENFERTKKIPKACIPPAGIAIWKDKNTKQSKPSTHKAVNSLLENSISFQPEKQHHIWAKKANKPMTPTHEALKGATLKERNQRERDPTARSNLPNYFHMGGILLL